MAKRKTTPLDIVTMGGQPWAKELLREETISLVCSALAGGYPPAGIPALLLAERKLNVSREQVWRLITYAFQQRWVRYHPPLHLELQERMRGAFPFLRQIKVVKTATLDAIASQGAAVLMDLMRRHVKENSRPQEYHCGFAGGGVLRRMARALAEEIQRNPAGLPKEIVFHAIVSGFNMHDPTTNPDSFFAYFGADQELPVSTSFVGLLAPGLVRRGEMEKLKKVHSIKAAFERVSEINAFVTSVGHWTGNHSGLCKMYLEHSQRSYNVLCEAGAVADLMWRPLAPSGPVLIPSDVRAMTLLELDALPGFIAKGKRVLLVCGPCSVCRGPRADALKVVLEQRESLITDLVVDHRSAALLPLPA